MRSRTGIIITILVSLGVHLVIFTAFFMPGRDFLTRLFEEQDASSSGRDIIVNVNADERRDRNKRTLLSDRDSRERGHLTPEKGDRWLNNSRYFNYDRGDASQEGGAGEDVLVSREDNRVYVTLGEYEKHKRLVEKKHGPEITIPDRNNITRENAIFYSQDGRFSFNTEKFKHFDYFRNMKDRIAAHWHPPLMANSYIRGYAPGRTRIMAIPSQEVKVFFTIDRRGTVQDVLLIDSLGNRPLDESCIESITNSRSFGPVPDEIDGEIIGIRFIFGYYVQ